jgi:hypothetical protein
LVEVFAATAEFAQWGCDLFSVKKDQGAGDEDE